MSSLDRILPFLKPIEDLLCDPTITEVMVNDGGRRIFVERDGTIEAVQDRTLETRNLTVAIKNIARACGDEISDAQPLLDARLEDGSRVAAMFPPCAVAGPVLTIPLWRDLLKQLLFLVANRRVGIDQRGFVFPQARERDQLRRPGYKLNVVA